MLDMTEEHVETWRGFKIVRVTHTSESGEQFTRYEVFRPSPNGFREAHIAETLVEARNAATAAALDNETRKQLCSICRQIHGHEIEHVSE